MDTSREKSIEVFAKDDAKWDKCFVDLNTLGYATNFKLSAYNPPNPDKPEPKPWNRQGAKVAKECQRFFG